MSFLITADHRSASAVGDKDGQVAKVVDVVIDGTNAKRSHAGDDHRAVEGAEPEQLFGQEAEVVQEIEELDRPAAEKSRDQGEQLVELIKGVDLLGRVLHGGDNGVELVVDLVHRVGRLKAHLDAGVGGVDRERLFDGHHDLNIVAAKDLLSADKAVNGGALGNGADVGRQHHVQKAEAGLALLDLLAAEFIGLADVEHIRIGVAGVTAHGHDVGHKFGHGIDGAQLSAVTAVAEATTALFGCVLLTHGWELLPFFSTSGSNLNSLLPL